MAGKREQRRARKQAWFDRGHQAFRSVFPEVLAQSIPDSRPVYVCPLCMRAYPNEAIDAETLTFEDAPPTWYTGRVRGIALTCKPCNNTLGSALDSHAQRAQKGGLIRGKATIEGVSLNVLFEVTRGELKIFGRPRQNPKGASVRFFENIQKLTDLKGNLSWREPYSRRMAKLAWLKAAYIVGFAQFGYRWAFSPGLRIVRQQLLNIDEELISSFKLQNATAPKNARRIVAIAEPPEISSLALQMGEHLVFLPHPDDLDFYERFKKYPPPRSGEFVGREIEWPTEPTHHYDFNVPTATVTI